MWKLRPRYSFSGNICFEISFFCLCSAVYCIVYTIYIYTISPTNFSRAVGVGGGGIYGGYFCLVSLEFISSGFIVLTVLLLAKHSRLIRCFRFEAKCETHAHIFPCFERIRIRTAQPKACACACSGRGRCRCRGRTRAAYPRL
jgi:hypothetical protein